MYLLVVDTTELIGSDDELVTLLLELFVLLFETVLEATLQNERKSNILINIRFTFTQEKSQENCYKTPRKLKGRHSFKQTLT